MERGVGSKKLYVFSNLRRFRKEWQAVAWSAFHLLSANLMKQLFWLVVLIFVTSARAERIDQEGRILGSLLFVTNSLLFNTTNADAVVSSMQIYPLDNPWNEDISRAPVLSNS